MLTKIIYYLLTAVVLVPPAVAVIYLIFLTIKGLILYWGDYWFVVAFFLWVVLLIIWVGMNVNSIDSLDSLLQYKATH